MSQYSLDLFDALTYADADVAIDVSRIFPAGADPADILGRLDAFSPSCAAMLAIEGGAIANPDEGRMVGHYWLRDADLAPDPALKTAILAALSQVSAFADAVHAGTIAPQRGGKFAHILIIGIGGSALGPQFVSAALTTAADKMKVHFFDNTDPDGIDRALDQIGDGLAATLAIVISKSGGTQETRNGMLEAAAAFAREGLDFAKHAVAVTGEGSALNKHAKSHGFLDTFPMWDWVGGRTSELSAVGLLPAALQGLDIAAMLDGAALMDTKTRRGQPRENPAAWLAFAWHEATGGTGKRDMVVLPYKDRLELFSRYLQQLVMESIGKRLDLQGNEVLQGLAVYGNKGSTDQHAYVQQLRDGVKNFFVTFIEVLQDRGADRPVLEVEPGVTSGDYLSGFLQGTRRALTDADRPSLTLTIQRCDARAIGMLIALYERAVGIYAHRIGVNAYHQPGVEAGKKAAQAVIDLQLRVVTALQQRRGQTLALAEIGNAAGSADTEAVYWVLRHLAANPGKGLVRTDGGFKAAGSSWRSA
ncbi:MAG: glucose-6-phosphate isomerase [Myxococcales bacterium]|nr:glucose-6-phosphate isomerase [Myxococcales bacterium]